MNLNFIPTLTQDGSTGLFNPEVNDIYHSSYGAYSEAFEKFINPSGLADYTRDNSSVKILDICYGMGYNTKAAIKTCAEANSKCSVIIDCVEIDFDVFVFSFLAKDDFFNFDVLEYFNLPFKDNTQIFDSIYKIIENENFVDFLTPKIRQSFINNKKEIYKDLSNVKTSTSLHNIYYGYTSLRNIQKNETTPKVPKISLTAYLDDARSTLGQLGSYYDFIFLDAFTPAKLPTLWSVEFFGILRGLLKDRGNITTYSNSAAVRNGMIEAGFFVGKTEKGTIALKDRCLLKTPLDEKSLGLLGTRAGIPFYDENLNSTKEEILALREKMVAESNLQSSSGYLKSFR